MKAKEYYSVLVPLINLILTGSKEVVIENDCIKLSDGYKFSVEEYAQANQSTHFYQCIIEFLDDLNQQQKVNIIKIIVENDVLLTTAILTNLMESKKTISDNQDNEAVFNKMMFEFLGSINTHSVIYRVLYMYLENLHRVEVREGHISEIEYNKVLNFNEQERMDNDILNMFS